MVMSIEPSCPSSYTELSMHTSCQAMHNRDLSITTKWFTVHGAMDSKWVQVLCKVSTWAALLCCSMHAGLQYRGSTVYQAKAIPIRMQPYTTQHYYGAERYIQPYTWQGIYSTPSCWAHCSLTLCHNKCNKVKHNHKCQINLCNKRKAQSSLCYC